MHTETEDEAFSREFAGELATFIQAMLGGELPIELRDKQIVLRPDDDHAIYLNVRAVRLSGVVRLRRPMPRRARKKHLKVVQ